MSLLIKGAKHHDFLEKDCVYMLLFNFNRTNSSTLFYWNDITKAEKSSLHYTYIKTEKHHTPGLNAPSYTLRKDKHNLICQYVPQFN